MKRFQNHPKMIEYHQGALCEEQQIACQLEHHRLPSGRRARRLLISIHESMCSAQARGTDGGAEALGIIFPRGPAPYDASPSWCPCFSAGNCDIRSGTSRSRTASIELIILRSMGVMQVRRRTVNASRRAYAAAKTKSQVTELGKLVPIQIPHHL